MISNEELEEIIKDVVRQDNRKKFATKEADLNRHISVRLPLGPIFLVFPTVFRKNLAKK